MAALSLDIFDTHVWVHFVVDRYLWHMRILFKIDVGAVWISYSFGLDGGPQRCGLGHGGYVVLDRNSPVAAQYVNDGVYGFGNFFVAGLRQMRRRVDQAAQFFGGGGRAVVDAQVWGYSGVSEGRFGDIAFCRRCL